MAAKMAVIQGPPMAAVLFTILPKSSDCLFLPAPFCKSAAGALAEKQDRTKTGASCKTKDGRRRQC